MMREPTLQDQIDAANAYEALMVPALSGQWAVKLADRAQIRPGQRVLDVACGTGVVGREVALRAGPTGVVVGLDPHPGMLAVAKRLAPALEWRQGVAESLPFPDQAFDAAVSQFGLMFFSDPRKALQEASRVVVPAGRLVFAVWAALATIPAYAVEVALLERLAGRRAADSLRAPFVLGDRQDLVGLFASAGIGRVEIVTHQGIARFPSVRIMVEADLRGWLPVMGVILPEEQIAEILEAAEQALRPYVAADGTVEFDISAHIVTATRPTCAVTV